VITLDWQVALENDDPCKRALPEMDQVQSWVAAALRDPWRLGETELTVRVVQPEESRALNDAYRDKDRPTNVLSFPFENPPGLEDLGEALPYLGDLVICAEVVAREAEEQNKPLMAHWAHMVVHGCLHLQGFDHLDAEDAEEMETLEAALLKELGVANPYQWLHDGVEQTDE
jgi:probable rRNA maturation factor